METTVIVSGSPGFLAGEPEGNRGVVDYGGGGETFFKSKSISDGFDSRTGLAGASGDIDLAIYLRIKVALGSNHDKNLAGLRIGD